MTAEPATIELEVAVTLDDQLRYTEWMLDRPARLWRRVLIQAGIIVLSPTVGLALGVLSFGPSDQDGLLASLRDAVHDPGLLRIMATVSGAILLVAVVQRLLRRPLLRRRLRRLLLERPGIDPTDPTLSESAHLTFGPDGFTGRTKASTVQHGWAAIKGLDDAGTVLVVKTGRFSGYVLPRRCISATELAAVTDQVRTHAAKGPA